MQLHHILSQSFLSFHRLHEATEAITEAKMQGKEVQAALEMMKQAAKSGKDATKDMTAKYGRSSRLGERSRGVLDAGAVSCYLLLESMADGIMEAME